MAHFDPPTFAYPQTLALGVLYPDIDTCKCQSIRKILPTALDQHRGASLPSYPQSTVRTADWLKLTTPSTHQSDCCRRKRCQSWGHQTSDQSPKNKKEDFLLWRILFCTQMYTRSMHAHVCYVKDGRSVTVSKFKPVKKRLKQSLSCHVWFLNAKMAKTLQTSKWRQGWLHPSCTGTHLLWGIYLRCVRAAEAGWWFISRFRGRGLDSGTFSHI